MGLPDLSAFTVAQKAALCLGSDMWHTAPVAEHDDRGEQRHPADAGPEVDVLDERPAPDECREARQVEDESGAEQREEAECVAPVQHALGAGEAADITPFATTTHQAAVPDDLAGALE